MLLQVHWLIAIFPINSGYFGGNIPLYIPRSVLLELQISIYIIPLNW